MLVAQPVERFPQLGDAFVAGFITGLWQSWPLDRTARFANAVGGLCVTGLGAAGGLRSLPETLSFIDEQSHLLEEGLQPDHRLQTG